MQILPQPNPGAIPLPAVGQTITVTVPADPNPAKGVLIFNQSSQMLDLILQSNNIWLNPFEASYIPLDLNPGNGTTFSVTPTALPGATLSSFNSILVIMVQQDDPDPVGYPWSLTASAIASGSTGVLLASTVSSSPSVVVTPSPAAQALHVYVTPGSGDECSVTVVGVDSGQQHGPTTPPMDTAGPEIAPWVIAIDPALEKTTGSMTVTIVGGGGIVGNWFVIESFTRSIVATKGAEVALQGTALVSMGPTSGAPTALVGGSSNGRVQPLQMNVAGNGLVVDATQMGSVPVTPPQANAGAQLLGGSLTTTNGANVAFGPTNTGVVVKTCSLSAVLVSATVGATAVVTVWVKDAFSGVMLAEVTLVIVTGTTVAMAEKEVTWAGGFQSTAAGTGNQQFQVQWNYFIATPTVISARASVGITY